MPPHWVWLPVNLPSISYKLQTAAADITLGDSDDEVSLHDPRHHIYLEELLVFSDVKLTLETALFVFTLLSHYSNVFEALLLS